MKMKKSKARFTSRLDQLLNTQVAIIPTNKTAKIKGGFIVEEISGI